MDQRRRAERIPIAHIRNISFLPNDPKLPSNLDVANISSVGLGLVSPQPIKDSIEKQQLDGTLMFGGDSFELSLCVIYQDDNYLGCEILTSPEEYPVHLRQYFETEMRAVELQPVEHNYQPIDPNDDILYREGPNNCYLLTISDDKSLKRYKVAYFGNVFEGGDGKIFTACQIIQDRDFDKFSKNGEVEMLKAVSKVSSDLKESVLRFVGGMSYLPEEHKEKIRDDLQALKTED